MPIPYVGRFAPSPSGPLHIGSLVAAMASYLDAKMHQGSWLLRIEDVDELRSVPGAADNIIQTLQTLGMVADDAILIQSQRQQFYQAACEQLDGLVYPCGCTRREIADSHSAIAADGASIYPGTCRPGLAPGKKGRILRLRVPDRGQDNEYIHFEDRRLGHQAQHLSSAVGDFVLRRADGYWAYQLAVVVDDAAQGVTHVVRGADLLESTARQIYLQHLLGYPQPTYLHLPLVNNALGEKLSKQNGAQALDMTHPLSELMHGAQFLGLHMTPPDSVANFWKEALPAWEYYCTQLRTTTTIR